MKSKFWIIISVILCVVCSVIVLSACNDNIDNHTHRDTNADGKCDICQCEIIVDGEETDSDKNTDDNTDKDDDNTDNTVAVTEVTLNKNTLTLEINGEETLKATVLPADAANTAINWSVNVSGIITVDNGKITAIAEGTAAVTATADGKSATCVVTVKAPTPKTEVTADEWELALSKKAFTNFTATVTLSGLKQNFVLKADLTNTVYCFNNNYNYFVYFSKDADNKYFTYTKNAQTEVYNRKIITQEKFDEQFYSLEQLTVIMFKDSFDKFNFNKDTHMYTAENVEIYGYFYNINFKFEDGKLVFADIKEKTDRMHMTVKYTDYGCTAITLPQNYADEIVCPITQGQRLKVAVGTKISALYEQFPTLITEQGKWELYVLVNDQWQKMTENDVVPYIKDFDCKFVFNADIDNKPEDVSFVLVGI